MCKLRRADELAAEGKNDEEIAAALEVSAATLYNWRRQYSGMDAEAAKELKKLRSRIAGNDSFRSDVLASGGLNDRNSSNGYLSRAEQLMAEVVGAEQAFLSTCGRSSTSSSAPCSALHL